MTARAKRYVKALPSLPMQIWPLTSGKVYEVRRYDSASKTVSVIDNVGQESWWTLGYSVEWCDPPPAAPVTASKNAPTRYVRAKRDYVDSHSGNKALVRGLCYDVLACATEKPDKPQVKVGCEDGVERWFDEGLYFHASVPEPVFKKDDSGKPPLDLLTGIPLGPLVEVAKALDHGAKKYGDTNWKNGTKSRYLAAALRHVWSWANGEQKDPETGLHPLAHAVANCLFLIGLDEKETK